MPFKKHSDAPWCRLVLTPNQQQWLDHIAIMCARLRNRLIYEWELQRLPPDYSRYAVYPSPLAVVQAAQRLYREPEFEGIPRYPLNRMAFILGRELEMSLRSASVRPVFTYPLDEVEFSIGTDAFKLNKQSIVFGKQTLWLKALVPSDVDVDYLRFHRNRNGVFKVYFHSKAK